MQVDEMYQRERFADFVREAEAEQARQEALAQLAPAPTVTARAPRGFYRTMVAAVGAGLVEVGTRLQGSTEGPPVASARPAGDCA